MFSSYYPNLAKFSEISTHTRRTPTGKTVLVRRKRKRQILNGLKAAGGGALAGYLLYTAAKGRGKYASRRLAADNAKINSEISRLGSLVKQAEKVAADNAKLRRLTNEAQKMFPNQSFKK